MKPQRKTLPEDATRWIPLNATSQLNVSFPRYNPPYYSTQDEVPDVELEKQPLQDDGVNK